MKTMKRILTLFLALILTVHFGFSRGNPIMVIECFDFDFGEVRNGEIAFTIPYLSCDSPNGGCPTGYVVHMDPPSCECVPDCSMMTEIFDCLDEQEPLCTTIEWIRGPDSLGNTDAVGICGCEPDGIQPCGCPPWLTIVTPSPDASAFFSPYCDIPEVECYNGEIDLSIDDGCGNFNPDGSVTVSIIIELLTPQQDPDIPRSLTIQDLINCNLTNGQNFVNELDEEYGGGTRVAFVDDDNNGFIEIEFTRDPDSLSEIDFLSAANDDIIVEPCALVEGIPTLSTWMIIALSLVLSISGLIFIKRKEVVRALGMF